MGTDKERIVASVEEILFNRNVYEAMSDVKNPYGDGRASWRIKDILKRYL